MAKGKEIKRRIKSISSMLQVTKAMEVTSSIKMRKAQEAAVRSKKYAFDGWKIALELSATYPLFNKKFVAQREGKILALVVASDKGLAGSYNADVLKKALQIIEENSLENIDFIVMGEKASRFVGKLGGNIVASFPLGQDIMFSRLSPVAYIGWNGFTTGKYGRFISIHTHFGSVGKMNATSLQILPLDIEKLKELANDETADTNIEYKIEPDDETLSEAIIRQITRALTYQVILESEAAEHASRMIAMKNASDAAKDLRDDFEFTFNQLRQASITQELAEISAGANAMDQ